jgi:aminoglycoside phosphotransferase (APT) family kinase protein
VQVGPIIASGRDCRIYAAGPGKVVRRARDGRSLEREASVMRHARRNGFPTPEVFDADGPDILMERVDGPTLMRDAHRRPWRLREHARLLVDLLDQLAAVPAPGWLPAAQGCVGRSLLHLDLHPLNVLLGDDGPRVVDWANASRGAPGADVANTWLTVATAMAATRAVPWIERRLMLGTFLDGIDRDAARPYLSVMADRRRADRYVSDAERATIDRLVARETAGQA